MHQQAKKFKPSPTFLYKCVLRVSGYLRMKSISYQNQWVERRKGPVAAKDMRADLLMLKGNPLKDLNVIAVPNLIVNHLIQPG